MKASSISHFLGSLSVFTPSRNTPPQVDVSAYKYVGLVGTKTWWWTLVSFVLWGDQQNADPKPKPGEKKPEKKPEPKPEKKPPRKGGRDPREPREPNPRSMRSFIIM